MIVLTRQDFVGRFEVTFPKINNRDMIVENELAELELQELTELFGNDLVAQFKANPLDPIFSDLYLPRVEYKHTSEGLKSVLLSLVYLRYQRENYAMSTENGRVLKDSSTSTSNFPYVRDLTMYNRAVNGWRAIQIYSRNNYADFSGKDKRIQIY